ncbi:magnesium chelatase [Streptomyces sp. NPDC047000]|uniref:magnesium chelatase n=1 Tax=Streptomyces sp. NPDC047000 TaxID=3155474 RepID=UPI0033D49717
MITPDVSPSDDRLHPLLRVLACSALGPGLDGVLLFDLEPELVNPVADAFSDILRLSEGRPVQRTVLGSATGDDELWLRPVLRPQEKGLGFSLVPGPLVDVAEDVTTLVVVPDLAWLGPAAMRAAVQLLGADVAVVERRGYRAQWRPRARWLAACSEAEVGRLSPHLLDRFPIRLNVSGLGLGGPDAQFAGRAPSGTGVGPCPALWADPEPGRCSGELPRSWRTVLAARSRPSCAVGEEAAARAVALAGTGTSSRRAITLARIARAQAVLDGAELCGPDQIDEAARLIGVSTAPAGNGRDDVPADLVPPAAPGQGSGGRPSPDGPVPDPSGADEVPPGSAPAVHADSPEALDAFQAHQDQAHASAYPEDDAQLLRDFHALRIPWQQRPVPSSARGPVTGVRPATVLRDLALVATAVEAAKYQHLSVRRALREPGDGRLVILPGDLRSYIRFPVAERMLVLLLDHTCRSGWDWQPALAPYLQWAYTGRASVCVVEVGGLDAAHELRAEHFVAHSLLDPRVGAALHRPAGRSTPLAHGLAVTDQLLRRAFQQQSDLVEAWLVVVSDGRGNVPLDASIGGRLTGPVRRTGVDDALAAASRIGAMGRIRLHSVVVDAARQPYPDLPFLLADALGGVTVAGRTATEVRHGG